VDAGGAVVAGAVVVGAVVAGVVGGVDVGADAVGVGVGFGAADVDEAGAGDGEADAPWLADADALADWEVPAGADPGAPAGWDVPGADDAAALAEADALRAAAEEDAEPDTLGAPEVDDSAAEEVSPAGDWLGVGVFPPVRVVTAKPAMPAAIMPAMIHTSTIGRHKRRCGRFRSAGEDGG
jgi:hypothetical protein